MLWLHGSWNRQGSKSLGVQTPPRTFVANPLVAFKFLKVARTDNLNFAKCLKY
jgi:hypothetical protein